MTDDEKRDDESEGEAVEVSVEAEVVDSEPEAGDVGDDARGYPELETAAEREQKQHEARKAELPQETRQWAMFCHLAGLAGFVVPFGGIVGPLVLWQMKREESPFIDQQGREALNFNITMTIAILVTSGLAAVGMIVFIGVLLIPVVFGLTIAWVAYAVIAALKASEGEAYRYPWSIRFVT